MMKKQNITKMLIVASLTIVPWSLNASPSSNDHFSDGSASSITAEEVNSLKQAILQGDPIDPAKLKQLFPGFVEREYDFGGDFDADCIPCVELCSDDDFESDPPSESEFDDGLEQGPGEKSVMGEENISVHCGESMSIRKRTAESLNWSLRDTIEGQINDIERSVQEMKDEQENGEEDGANYAELITDQLNLVRYSIQQVDFYHEKIDQETFRILLDCFNRSIHLNALPATEKKYLAEYIITVVTGLSPSVLTKECRAELNAFCFQIWDEVRSGMAVADESVESE